MFIKALFFCAWVTIAHIIIFLLGTVLPCPMTNGKFYLSFLSIGWSISAGGVWLIEEAAATEMGMPPPPEDVYESIQDEWNRLGGKASWIMAIGASHSLIAFHMGQKMVRQESLTTEIVIIVISFLLQTFLWHLDYQELQERAQIKKNKNTVPSRIFLVPYLF